MILEKRGKEKLAKIKKVSPPINEVVQEYDTIRVQEKTLKERKKYLADIIKDYAQEHGVKDDTGSLYCDSDSFIYGATAVKKTTLDEEKALEYLKASKDPEVNACVVTKEYVNEDAVEECITKGLLTVEEVQKLVNTKVSYSVSVKEKEVIEDVQEYELQKASKVKKKRG